MLKNSIDLEETRNSILKLFPEYVDSFDNVMNGHEQYFANMFVCKKNIFDNYASWLFTILFDVEEKLDLSDRDSYCRRVFGFIAERLLMVWVRFNNLKVYEMQVNEIGEKIEVTEAVNKLVSLKKEKRITEAMELITKIKKNYPQMFASISDTEGRLREVATHISQEYYEKKRTILETQEVNNKGIVIIIATNNETYMSECMSYISNLIVPEGFELSVLEVREGKSMASAYNEGMEASNSKYKLYIHQDVFLCNPMILVEIINAFTRDPELGIVGVCGAKKIPQNGICYNSWDVKGVVANNSVHSFLMTGNSSETSIVEAIDGLLIATQYNVYWREDLFDKWDFYDISHSLEFRRLGYKVGVLPTDTIWCIHDCGHSSLANYYDQNNVFLKEYSDFCSGVSTHSGEEYSAKENELINSVVLNAEKYYDHCSEEMYEIVKDTYENTSRNTRLSYMYIIYYLRRSDMKTYGTWKWGKQFLSFQEAKDALIKLRFLIWRIELGLLDSCVLIEMLDSDQISTENMGYIVSITAINPTFLYDELGIRNPLEEKVLSFDQYQRYATISDIITRIYPRRCKVLEIGANAQKNLGYMLRGKTIFYSDIHTPEGFENDKHFFVADATNLVGIKDNSYKFVVSSDVFEHIPGELRNKFLSELYRVAEEAVIICFPFKTEYTERAEQEVNQYYKKICGKDYIWLKEHIELGLPELDEIISMIQEEKMHYELFMHGDIEVWKEMMKSHFMAVFVPEMLERRIALDQFYSEKVYKSDVSDECYRVFLLLYKDICNKELYHEIVEDLFEPDKSIQKEFRQIIKEEKEIGLIRAIAFNNIKC